VGGAASPIDPDDVAAMAAAMEQLLSPAAAAAATARGIIEARRFSWEVAARTARDAYRSAIAARARRRK
nr:glycosyltransferase family 1 protein [Acidobacteriota bacterium]